MRAQLTVIFIIPLVLLALPVGADIPRTADGRPDLSGTYDIATLTPLERPEAYGENLFLAPEEAQKLVDEAQAFIEEDAQHSDPNRKAPPAGGDGSTGAAGNVGGYNAFWIDPGNDRFMIDGKFRTSIIFDPVNGRLPAQTPIGQQRRAALFALFGQNTGTAWWLGREGPGPYDDPEMRPLGERCLLAFGSSAGPPMLPTLYNNLKRIVQTRDYVMILNEMVHDARIIRLAGGHTPGIRQWMGDSVGHWEGDTLVVRTENFKTKSGLYFFGATEALRVVERFTRTSKDQLLYAFTVEDPAAWESSWSGEYPWPATDTRVYEYACHEGNYALGNILRGARLLEADAAAGGSGQSSD